MIKILKDILSFLNLKAQESSCRIGFFCENDYIFQYLEPYILKRSEGEKILIISFEKISNKPIDQSTIFVFQSQFFRELVFLTLKLKVLYSSTPDLNQTIFKRSKFSKCKYIYLQHNPVSSTMIYNSSAFDSFDAVQAVNIYQYNDMKEIICKKELKTKVFKSRYLFLKNQSKKNINQLPSTDLIIAPSWNSGFYKLQCHTLLKKFLSESSISYKFRPHPMSLKKKEISIYDLEKLGMSIDMENSINFYKYNFLISDWSGIFLEYAWIFKRRAFLINTPKKILNKSYLNYKNRPVEITLRNVLGKTYEVENIQNIISEIQILKRELKEKNKISECESVKKEIKENFFTEL